MRGADCEQSSMCSYILAERRVAKDHLLQAIRAVAEGALEQAAAMMRWDCQTLSASPLENRVLFGHVHPLDGPQSAFFRSAGRNENFRASAHECVTHRRLLSRAHLMHHIDQGNHVVNRRFRQNAMPQVENMAGPPARLVENLAYSPLDLRNFRK
jgi:hypothetical protein